MGEGMEGERVKVSEGERQEAGGSPRRKEKGTE